MKNIIVIILIALSFNGYSQELSKKEQKKIAKEEKKAKKEAEYQEVAKITDLMLKMHRFVVEADYVGDGKGQRTPVSSTINFIAVDSTEAVIQLGTFYGIGYNGVGGITVDGKVTKYDLTENEGKKGKSYTLILFVTTTLGSYDIVLHISSNGLTTATLRGTTYGALEYTGKLVPIGLSRVYKGSSF